MLPEKITLKVSRLEEQIGVQLGYTGLPLPGLFAFQSLECCAPMWDSGAGASDSMDPCVCALNPAEAGLSYEIKVCQRQVIVSVWPVFRSH